MSKFPPIFLQEKTRRISLFLFMNDHKGSRNPDEWNLDPNTSWIAKGNWFPGRSQFVSLFLYFLTVLYLWGYFSSCFHIMWPIGNTLVAERNKKKPAPLFFARVAFYPSLLWGIVTESSTKTWYDRVDTNVILGALPFKSQTKEVSAPFSPVSLLS